MRMVSIAAAAGLAAGSLAMGSATLAAPAHANVPARVQYVSTIVYGTAYRTTLGTVSCPTGTFVVSASAAHANHITSLTPLRNSRTSPGLANFTAVAATASPYPDRPAGAAYMLLQAGCVPAARVSGALSRSLTVAPENGNRNGSRGIARCPAGLRAFGGGAYFLAADNHISTAATNMYENSVTADGAAWTYRGATAKTTDRLVVTTQCAPLAGSRITQASVDTPPPVPFPTGVFGSASCIIGYTVLSGGVTFANLDNTEGAGGVTELWTSEGGVGVIGYPYGTSRLTVRAQCVPPGSF